MDKNCLHVKLKAVVQNDDLLKIGELRFRVVNNNTTTILPFWVASSIPIDVNIIGDGYLYEDSITDPQNVTKTLQNVTTTVGRRLSPGDYVVSISNKYALTRISLNSSTLSDCNIYFNIDDLAFSTGLMNMNMMGTQSKEWDITGNINSLPSGCDLRISYSKLTGTTAKYGTFIFYNTSTNVWPSKYITGSLEEFISNLNSSNYNQTLAFDIYRESNITLNGQTLAITFFRATVDASGNAVIKDYSNNTLASYTKSTNTWTYPS